MTRRFRDVASFDETTAAHAQQQLTDVVSVTASILDYDHHRPAQLSRSRVNLAPCNLART